MQIIYISGPMSNIPLFNKPAFDEAATQLMRLGYRVLNPAEVKISGGEWVDFMRADLKIMMDADMVATLHGWESSRGASLEVYIAEKLDIPVVTAESLLDGEKASQL
jgi:hypothetical protein